MISIIVKNLSAYSYRNLSGISLEFCENINIIMGENGQGKTNVLEAVWFFTTGKSFRTASVKDCIMFNENAARLSIEYNAYEYDNKCDIILPANEKKQIKRNGIELKKTSELVGSFTGVLFSPEHLTLVKDGAAPRRRFLDFAICQLRPKYLSLLLTYNKILSQRNAVLRLAADKKQLDTLDVWDAKLAETAAVIINLRNSFVEKLQHYTSRIYSEISGSREQMTLKYKWSGNNQPTDVNEVYEFLLAKLKKNRARELREYVTLCGPHRDDIEIFTDNKPARYFASQGQQRSCVLALKIAESELIHKEYGEYPVLLFDDVLSELDEGRQQYILNKIQNKQVILTCCELNKLSKIGEKKIFNIAKGEVS